MVEEVRGGQCSVPGETEVTWLVIKSSHCHCHLHCSPLSQCDPSDWRMSCYWVAAPLPVSQAHCYIFIFIWPGCARPRRNLEIKSSLKINSSAIGKLYESEVYFEKFHILDLDTGPSSPSSLIGNMARWCPVSHRTTDVSPHEKVPPRSDLAWLFNLLYLTSHDN